MKRWKKNLLVLALLSFAVIFANVTPKYHTVSAASKTTLNYKKKTLSKGQTLKLKVKGTKKKVKKTLPILIAQLRSADFLKFDMGKVYMLVAIAILPVIIVYLLLSKFIVRGVALGGVKG